MEFFPLKPETFGIDISDLSIKVVKLKERKGKYILSSFSKIKIKEGVIKNGEIKNEEKAVSYIREALKSVKGEKIRTKYVIVSLPEEKTFLTVVPMPLMSDEELSSAVLFEAENYIPLSLDKVYLSWEKLPLSSEISQRIEVLVCACPKKVANSYLRVLKKAGLEPIAFETESLAIARSLIPKSERNLATLILDLGETKTLLAIYFKNSVRFTTNLPISGKLFTELIAKNLKIKFSAAEKLKIEYGLKEALKMKFVDPMKIFKVEKGKIFEALVPALVDLIEQIKKAMTFFETHDHRFLKGGKIKKILICGGGANLKGLREFLALKLQVPVEYGNPFTNLSFLKPPSLPFEKTLSLTTAIGLAMRKYD